MKTTFTINWAPVILLSTLGLSICMIMRWLGMILGWWDMEESITVLIYLLAAVWLPIPLVIEREANMRERRELSREKRELTEQLNAAQWLVEESRRTRQPVPPPAPKRNDVTPATPRNAPRYA